MKHHQSVTLTRRHCDVIRSIQTALRSNPNEFPLKCVFENGRKWWISNRSQFFLKSFHTKQTGEKKESPKMSESGMCLHWAHVSDCWWRQWQAMKVSNCLMVIRWSVCVCAWQIIAIIHLFICWILWMLVPVRQDILH